jgi:hypothetical protein
MCCHGAVAIKKTGNVYAFEALDELCFKPKNYKVSRVQGGGLVLCARSGRGLLDIRPRLRNSILFH